jgi:hypothetical protein
VKRHAHENTSPFAVGRASPNVARDIPFCGSEELGAERPIRAKRLGASAQNDDKARDFG